MFRSIELKRSCCQAWDRRALTLLELMVVLVILSVVATVAVNSLQPRVETARFEQTRKLIGNIQTAVIGSSEARQTDGTPLVSGFLADIGRLPRPGSSALPAGNEGMELAALWDPDSTLATSFPFRFRSGPQTPVDYSHIQIPCGWRGPYLQLPIGTTNLTDAWGRPFEFEFAADGTIDCVIWQPVGEFDAKMSCALKTGKVIVSGTIHFGIEQPGTVEVVLLGPNPDESLSELAVFADEDTNAATFAFSNVAVGMRALHIRYDDRQMTRYLQVPHRGLTLALDLSEPNQ